MYTIKLDIAKRLKALSAVFRRTSGNFREAFSVERPGGEG
jgi:hypothetical protein